MTKLNVALVGYGLSGKFFHAPFIEASKSYVLKYIVSSKVSDIKLNYPNVSVYSELKDLPLNDIGLVIISTPNHLHFEQARFALSHQKNVLVEKPICVSSIQAKKLYKLAKENKVVLSVYHNRRYDDDFLTVKELIQKKTLGELVYFESNFDRFRPKIKNENWREMKSSVGGGVLFDLGSHLIDQAISLFGKADSFYGDVAYQREGAQQDDFFRVNLNYNKLRVSLSASSVACIQRPRFLVHGTEGSFLSYDLDEQETFLKSQKELQNYDSSRFAVLKIKDKESKLRLKKSSYSAFFDDLYDSIMEKSDHVKEADVIEVLSIIEKIHLKT